MTNKLVPFFEPSSVAIIGASAAPGKAGNDVIVNILANGYAGKLYPVNPKGGKILGIDVYSSIASLPRDIDVAVIILPAAATAKAMRECADQGIRHFVLSSGGFAEVDEAGAQIQRELDTHHPGEGAPCPGSEHVGPYLDARGVHLHLLSPGEDPRRPGLLRRPDGEFRHPYPEVHPDRRAFRRRPGGGAGEQGRHR